MIQISPAVYDFLSQFGVPVWIGGNVPPEAKYPYITWAPVETPWDDTTLTTIRLWDRSSNYANLAAIADSIGSALDPHAMLPVDGGYVSLCKSNPFAQAESLQNDIKTIILQCEISTMVL